MVALVRTCNHNVETRSSSYCACVVSDSVGVLFGDPVCESLVPGFFGRTIMEIGG